MCSKLLPGTTLRLRLSVTPQTLQSSAQPSNGVFGVFGLLRWYGWRHYEWIAVWLVYGPCARVALLSKWQQKTQSRIAIDCNLA